MELLGFYNPCTKKLCLIFNEILMKTTHKIAVLGGGGKAGKYLVKTLIERGIACKVLLRTPENFQIKNPLLEIIQGNARRLDAIHLVLKDCNALISTLGQPQGESGTYAEVTQNIISSMNQYKIKRYIVATGLQVDTPFDVKGPKTQYATEWMKTNFKKATIERQEEYELLTKCNLDWTLVRLPMIHLTDQKGKIVADIQDCPNDKINALDLASFFIDQLSSDTYLRKAPFIASL